MNKNLQAVIGALFLAGGIALGVFTTHDSAAFLTGLFGFLVLTDADVV